MTLNSSSQILGKSVKIRWLCFLAFFSFIFFYSHYAVANPGITKEEYRVLPSYCRNQGLVAQSLYNPDNAEAWKQALGPVYNHIHHLCWGLVNMMRAYKLGTSSSHGTNQLHQAIDNFIYTLERTQKDSPVRFELLTKMGEAYVGLKQYRKAEDAFEQVLAEKPDHEPTYIWWVQFLVKNGNTREALVIAERGKKNIPNSKALDKLIANIHGRREKRATTP
jgi:Putative Zn-dependent protease, contains TPR repeats